MKVKHLCPHCEAILESECPDIGEGARIEQFAPLGKAIIEMRLLHVIMNCKALEDANNA